MDLIPPTDGMRGTELSLGEKQELFARLWMTFLIWFHSHVNWRMRLGEGFVGQTDAADGDYDGPHMQGGAHYNKIGQDFDFFILLPDGTRKHLTTWASEWGECGIYWKSLHPLARWGGDFKSKDYNHFSLFHAGKS